MLMITSGFENVLVVLNIDLKILAMLKQYTDLQYHFRTANYTFFIRTRNNSK